MHQNLHNCSRLLKGFRNLSSGRASGWVATPSPSCVHVSEGLTAHPLPQRPPKRPCCGPAPQHLPRCPPGTISCMFFRPHVPAVLACSVIEQAGLTVQQAFSSYGLQHPRCCHCLIPATSLREKVQRLNTWLSLRIGTAST